MSVLDAYRRLADMQDKPLPAMEAGGVELSSETLRDAEQVLVRWNACAPVQGWLLFQSHQALFDNGMPTPAPAWGNLLAAEGVDADDISWSLAQTGDGRWILTRLAPVVGEQPMDEVRLLANGVPDTYLRYQRYWQYRPESGRLEQAVARFRGIVQGAQHG